MSWETIPRMVLGAGDRFGAAEAVVDGPLRLDFTAPAGVPMIDLKSDFLASGSPLECEVSGDDVSDIVFTSGTTGRPKGVLMTHAQNLRLFAEWCDLAGLRDGDRYLIVNPFFHMFGYKAGCLASLIRGATILQTIMTGYGLTEAGTVTASRSGDSFEEIATTVGTPCDGLEVGIADDGEVLVRGYSVMRGYLDNPAATAEAIDEDGWLHTGDLGTLGEKGHLRIIGRKKDMFIVGGFNAYPAEIESFLLEHPAVAQVAVIGVPDERLGQVGKAFVVKRSPVTEEELVGWSRDRMAGFKAPRSVTFLDELPLNATGKVMKNLLR